MQRPLARRLAALIGGLCCGVPLAGSSLAAAPEPTKPVDLSRYFGRWYEIARTPNLFEHGAECDAPTADYGADGGGRIRVVQTCHRGSPTGAETIYRATGRILDPGINARIKLTYYLVISKEYRVLDYARDYKWAIVADSTGKFVWLLSRAPDVAAATRSEMLQRAQSLGFDVGRLEFPPQR
jgi:apolipoprotein D and lipocalin family protein